jgi:hypothetical protein
MDAEEDGDRVRVGTVVDRNAFANACVPASVIRMAG